MKSGLPSHLEHLDDHQLKAALAESNCVVTAGAGAGKTTVLAARYVHHVIEERIPVRAILALTFTRKAAAEMHERIYKELSKQESEWAALQREDFRNARITTLDAFCSEIVTRSSREFGYSPDFSVDQERCADFSRVIAERYVRRHRNDAGIAEMLRTFGWEKVTSGVFASMGEHLVTPCSLRAPAFAPMKSSLQEFARRTAHTMLHEIAGLSQGILATCASIPEPRRDCAAAETAAQAVSGYMAGTDFPGARDILQHISRQPLQMLLHRLSFLGLKAYGRDESEQAVKEAAKIARDKAAALLDLGKWYEYFPVHASVLDHLDRFAEELSETKRLADVMDFKDLGRCAVDILSRRKDIRSYWKNSITRIMIDEFQDDNRLQKDLLFLLAEQDSVSGPGIPAAENLDRNKLFFVGDEKQSIYRFRGADVSVFMHLSRELSAASSGRPEDCRSHTLAYNYRSTGRLIEFFNDFFPEVLSANPDFPDDDFSALYSPMSGKEASEGKELSAPPTVPSKIEYRILDPAARISVSEEVHPALEPDDALAFRIAGFIRESCGRIAVRDQSGRKGAARPAGWGDFAVLLRTTTNQHRLERYFRLFGIPYEAGSPKGLFRESPANDIFNILSYLFDPSDARAFAAVLRSPLCGISDGGFLTLLGAGLCSFDSDKFPPGIAESLGNEDLAGLSEADRFFGRLSGMARGSTISHIVDFIWREAGLESAIAAKKSAHPFLEHFDHLHHLATKTEENGGGIADFINRLAPLVSGESDAIEIENTPKNQTGGVKILTIHKSKGLQFPIVIIPWVENQGSSGGDSPPWEMLDEGIAFDMKPWETAGAKSENVLYSLAKKREDAKDDAEGRRLLYVACTRAEDHLVFFGKIPGRNETRFRSFRSHLEAYCSRKERAPGSPNIMDRVEIPPVGTEEMRALYAGQYEEAAGPSTAVIPGTPQAPAESVPGARVTLTVTEINAQSEHAAGEWDPGRGKSQETPTDAPDSDIPADIFGQLCHDAVEKAILSGTTAGYSAPVSLLSSMDSDIAEKALRHAVRFAERFLSDDFMKSLPAKRRMETEKAFLMKIGRFIIEGRIDLLVETDEELVMLDFKTDRVMDANAYRVQMDLYRRAVAGFSPGKTMRCGFYWLRYGKFSWDPAPLEDRMLGIQLESTAVLPMSTAGSPE
jgi:ATP-dependent helicase/nuclease subunit A